MTTTNGLHPTTPADQLQNRLNEPQTADALHSLLDNADILAFSVSALDGFVRRGDTIADGIAESVADLRATAPQVEANPGELMAQLLGQLPQLLELTSQLTTLASSPEFQRVFALLSKPQTLNAISQLLENMELVAFLVSSIDGLLQRSETVADNIADSMAEARQVASGGDANLAANLGTVAQSLPQLAESAPQLIDALPQLVDTLPQLLGVAEKLQPLLDSGALDNLLASGVLEPKAIEVIGKAGGALSQTVDADSGDVKPVGTFGLLRAMGDPNVQTALGFLMKVASNFGKELK